MNMNSIEPTGAPAVRRSPGFNRLFAPGRLTIGFILPLEAYPDQPAPTMVDHASIAKYADEQGFGGVWARDVPLFDPMFGDTGQLFEPFSYLGYLAAATKDLALATGSAVITLRHPLHLAKQATSVDQMSGGRLILGISSGDRPTEYPAFGLEAEFESRGERFRDAFDVFNLATEKSFPQHHSSRFGTLSANLTLVPRPANGSIPLIVTGRSRQDLNWIAKHADGWLYYFLTPEQLAPLVHGWHELVKSECGEDAFKPFFQGLFFDLAEDPNHPAQRIHSGIRTGRNALVDYLSSLQAMGVNHVALNLKASRRPAFDVLQELSEFVLPNFPSHAFFIWEANH